MQTHARIKKVKKTKKIKPTTNPTAEMPDVSSTGFFNNKTVLQAHAPAQSVPESFILYDSGHLLRATNLGN